MRRGAASERTRFGNGFADGDPDSVGTRGPAAAVKPPRKANWRHANVLAAASAKHGACGASK